MILHSALALVFIDAIAAVPLFQDPVSIGVVVRNNVFHCTCLRMGISDPLITCSSEMTFFDPICLDFYESCGCTPVPVLKKREGSDSDCFISPFEQISNEESSSSEEASDDEVSPFEEFAVQTLESDDLGPIGPNPLGPEPNEEPFENWLDEPLPAVLVEPKAVGAQILSYSDGVEKTYEITEVIKIPTKEADYFNVYRVTSDGSEYILREPTNPNHDVTNEVNVLVMVDQFVACKMAPNPNVVVKIQPGITMFDMIPRYLDDDQKLSELYNGGQMALEAFHKMNIYHGDAHTANIMVTEDMEKFSLIDFANSHYYEPSPGDPTPVLTGGMNRIDELFYEERFTSAVAYYGRSVKVKYQDGAFIVTSMW